MLIKTGLAVSQMSGTMGGVVASHNRFGQYFRRWTKPTDPQSPAQMQRRAALASGVVAWGLLSDANKETWNVYAANTPWANRLGEAVYLSGFQMYLRTFTFFKSITDELGGDAADVQACGSAGGLPDNMSGAVATVSVAAGLSLEFDDSAAWCSAAGNVCLIRMSRPRPATRIFGNGPYRIAGNVIGAVVPAESPKVIVTASLPWAINVGDRVDFLMRLVTSDMTLSNTIRVTAVVGA